MRHPRSGRDLRPARALALAVLLASFALPGCAVTSRLRPRGVSRATAADVPKLNPTQKRLLDAAEQAALAPAEPYWPYHAAEILIEADSIGRAETSLKTALARDPRYPPALALLSRLYFRAGRHEEGVRLLEPIRAPGAFPHGVPPELLAALALHYDAQDRMSDAATILREAGNSPRARGAAGYLALRSDRPDSARGWVESAAESDGRSAANQNNLGIVRLRAGDADAARRAFLRAIDIDPGLAGPYYNLAILEKFYRFDDQAAARWFRSYWERSHQDPDSLRGQIDLGVPRKLARDEAWR